MKWEDEYAEAGCLKLHVTATGSWSVEWNEHGGIIAGNAETEAAGRRAVEEAAANIGRAILGDVYAGRAVAYWSIPVVERVGVEIATMSALEDVIGIVGKELDQQATARVAAWFASKYGKHN